MRHTILARDHDALTAPIRAHEGRRGLTSRPADPRWLAALVLLACVAAGLMVVPLSTLSGGRVHVVAGAAPGDVAPTANTIIGVRGDPVGVSGGRPASPSLFERRLEHLRMSQPNLRTYTYVLAKPAFARQAAFRDAGARTLEARTLEARIPGARMPGARTRRGRTRWLRTRAPPVRSRRAAPRRPACPSMSARWRARRWSRPRARSSCSRRGNTPAAILEGRPAWRPTTPTSASALLVAQAGERGRSVRRRRPRGTRRPRPRPGRARRPDPGWAGPRSPGRRDRRQSRSASRSPARATVLGAVALTRRRAIRGRSSRTPPRRPPSSRAADGQPERLQRRVRRGRVAARGPLRPGRPGQAGPLARRRSSSASAGATWTSRSPPSPDGHRVHPGQSRNVGWPAGIRRSPTFPSRRAGGNGASTASPADHGASAGLLQRRRAVRFASFLLRKPVAAGRLGDGFGWRIHPVLKDRRFHEGVDYAAPYGSPIVAAGAGVVEKIDAQWGYGKYIRIKHDQGYETTYAHIAGTAANGEGSVPPRGAGRDDCLRRVDRPLDRAAPVLRGQDQQQRRRPAPHQAGRRRDPARGSTGRVRTCASIASTCS